MLSSAGGDNSKYPREKLGDGCNVVKHLYGFMWKHAMHTQGKTLLPKPQMDRMTTAALTRLKEVVEPLQHIYPSGRLMKRRRGGESIAASNLKLRLANEETNEAQAPHFIMEDMKGRKWSSSIENIKKSLGDKLKSSLLNLNLERKVNISSE